MSRGNPRLGPPSIERAAKIVSHRLTNKIRHAMQIDLFESNEEIRMRETGGSGLFVDASVPEYQAGTGDRKETADNDARLT